MIYENGESYGQTIIGKTFISSIWIGTKNGAIKIWESISNCIAGGWWQYGHGWQYGTGWGEKRK